MKNQKNKLTLNLDTLKTLTAPQLVTGGGGGGIAPTGSNNVSTGTSVISSGTSIISVSTSVISH